MSGTEALLIPAIAGTGLSIYGQISAAEAQVEAAKKKEALQNLQANELLERQKINETTLQQQGAVAAARYSSASAATGFEGAGIGGQLEIFRNVQDAILNSRREAKFRADMIRAGAEIERGYADQQLQASYLTSAGSLLSSGAQTYWLLKGPDQKPK